MLKAIAVGFGTLLAPFLVIGICVLILLAVVKVFDEDGSSSLKEWLTWLLVGAVAVYVFYCWGPAHFF